MCNLNKFKKYNKKYNKNDLHGFAQFIHLIIFCQNINTDPLFFLYLSKKCFIDLSNLQFSDLRTWKLKKVILCCQFLKKVASAQLWYLQHCGHKLKTETSYICVRHKQRPYRKDRLPRYFNCCRQLANLRILQGICLYNALVWIVCYKPGQSFSGCRVWGSVDFDSKYKILLGETRAHGEPIHEEEKKFKTRIYIIIPIFPPPIISDWRKLGWRGRPTLCFLADYSKYVVPVRKIGQ